MKSADAPHTITYRFSFDDGRENCFNVRLHPRTLQIVDAPEEPLPDWTRLEFHRCGNCPLSPDQHPRCPIAARIVGLVEGFRDARSFDPVAVTVETPHRAFLHQTSVQKGLSSLLGIYMVSSGCPVMNTLRPMVEFHLPFASVAETTYRTIGMYVMAQFFRQRRGGEPDFALDKLPALLDEVRQVDEGFCRRIGALGVEDASLNALVILSTFGEAVAYTVVKQDLERWERVFRDHYG